MAGRRMTVLTKLDQESVSHSRVLRGRCDQSLSISVFDKLTSSSVVVLSCRMRTCHYTGRACIGVGSRRTAKRFMSPGEPTSDDPKKNYKYASPLRANLTGLSETTDALGASPRWCVGCPNHGGDCCPRGARQSDAGAFSGLGLGLMS